MPSGRLMTGMQMTQARELGSEVGTCGAVAKARLCIGEGQSASVCPRCHLEVGIVGYVFLCVMYARRLGWVLLMVIDVVKKNPRTFDVCVCVIISQLKSSLPLTSSTVPLSSVLTPFHVLYPFPYSTVARMEAQNRSLC